MSSIHFVWYQLHFSSNTLNKCKLSIDSYQIHQYQIFILIIYLEISPQYHSASFSRLLMSVMADGTTFDLSGFAGRTGNRHTEIILY